MTAADHAALNSLPHYLREIAVDSGADLSGLELHINEDGTPGLPATQIAHFIGTRMARVRADLNDLINVVAGVTYHFARMER